MRKLLLSLLIMASLLLTSCSQAAPASPTFSVELTTEEASAPAMECQVVSMSPTQGPTESSMFPPPQADDWILGDNEDAVLTITEYSDFQCPYCAQLAVTLEEFQKKYPDDVRVIFRHFPLPSHQLAFLGAQATEAAGQQGKFWEMHHVIFASQGAWAGMNPDQFSDWLEEQAQTLKLDQAKFIEDMTSQAVIDKVQQAQDHGIEIQIPGTPLLLLNGQYYQGPRDLVSLESILRMYDLQDRQFTACPPMLIDIKKEYTATLKTEQGDIVLQLFPDKAPMAVNSFVFLARRGWFNNTPFHRVLPGFVAQSGDPSGSGYGGPGYYFANEISDLKFDKAGVVAMANAGPDSNGSQFFITYDQTAQLDGQFTIFGQVIQGMDIAEKLTARDPAQLGDLPEGTKILSIQIQEK